MRLLCGIAMAILVWPAAGFASGTCRAESGDRVVPLVELYTSEGCDSCPAADRWLSTHFPAGSRTDAVALAFHVDYWDRLGWKDRFATPAYTARQHETMRANRSTFVYTPQMVLQGRDYTDWRRGAPATAIATAVTRAARARIAVQATVETSAVVVQADVKLAEPPRRDTSIAFAYVDSGLTSDVKAGENRGAKLTHDHVVRALATRPLTAAAGSFSVRLPRPVEAGEHPTLVAFVQDVASGDILQTLAVPLEGCR
jgi:hypothetical protein